MAASNFPRIPPRRKSPARSLPRNIVSGASYQSKPRPVPPHAERRAQAVIESVSPLLVPCPKCSAPFGRWCWEMRRTGAVA